MALRRGRTISWADDGRTFPPVASREADDAREARVATMSIGESTTLPAAAPKSKSGQNWVPNPSAASALPRAFVSAFSM